MSNTKHQTAKEAVYQFYNNLWKNRSWGKPVHFTAADLTAFVRGATQHSYSPETAMRRLRELRQDGWLEYKRDGNKLLAVW